MKPDKTISRLTRLTKILLHLQSRRVITSHELATKFSVSQRTVYRDLRALEDAGIPLIGEIGTGYFLPDDFRVPPMMFSENEINALITARQLLSANPDRSIVENLDTVVVKVKALLKHTARDKAERIEQRIKIYDAAKGDKTTYLSIIQSAISSCNIVELKYHAIYSDQVSSRAIEPLAVYYTKDKWLIIAHCRLRNALREFRLDRILSLQSMAVVFQERKFSFEEYLNAIISENS
jgi:predicted DNA-binding transcriptional regulator YafY